MNKKRLIILIILTIFIIGMVCGTATASHTFKVGKYKATVSDSKYNKMKQDAKKGKYVCVFLKTGKYKTYKIPKYKTVKKKVWKYTKILVDKTVYPEDGSESTYYDYNYKYAQYTKKGWTYYGYKIVHDKNTVKTYDKFKKKVTKKVQVKNGYKKVKKPIYITVSNSDETGKLYKKVSVTDLWTDYERL